MEEAEPAENGGAEGDGFARRWSNRHSMALS